VTIVLISSIFFDIYFLMGFQVSQRLIHPAISHLASHEIDELIGGYIGGISARALIKQFKIDVSAGQLRRILPPKILDQICAACGTGMVQEVPSRQAKKIGVGRVRCSTCRHEENQTCRCQYCVTQRIRQRAEENERLHTTTVHAIRAEQLKCPTVTCTLADLPLAEAAAFLALIRCCPLDANQVGCPLSECAVPFAPTSTLRNNMLDLLRRRGLIAISEHSDMKTLRIEDEKIICEAQNVRWVVPAEDAPQLISRIEQAGLSRFWPEHWYAEAEEFWLLLALAECRQYYDYSAQIRGLQTGGEVAVTKMLSNLLMDFSVGQAYRVIWHGAKDTSDFLVRENPNRMHAANFMIGACQRWADRARAGGWQVIPFKRNFDLPRCMISYVLLDVIFKIGDNGFTAPICMENICLN
jgi:hypothetical protein